MLEPETPENVCNSQNEETQPEMMNGCVATFNTPGTLLNLNARGCQATQMSGAGVRVVAWRHHVVPVMQQLQMPQTTFLHFFDPLQATLDKVGSFDRLAARWFAGGMRGGRVPSLIPRPWPRASPGNCLAHRRACALG